MAKEDAAKEYQQTGTGRRLREMWEHKTGERLGPAWDAAFMNWVDAYGLPLVIDAMQDVADSAHRQNNTLPPAQRQPPKIQSVPAYAAVECAEAADPGMRDCYLVRGRMRSKFYGADAGEIIAVLGRLMRDGMSASAMHKAVDDTDTLEDCCAALGVDKSEFQEIFGAPVINHQVFVREDEPAWRLWDAHLRKTTGKGPPMNKHFGWYFPTKLPPDQLPKRARRMASR
jgi:hypothetical protein